MDDARVSRCGCALPHRPRARLASHLRASTITATGVRSTAPFAYAMRGVESRMFVAVLSNSSLLDAVSSIWASCVTPNPGLQAAASCAA
jgi:hypothetical protein